MTELELALQKLQATKALVADIRRKEREAEERRAAGLKLVKAKMRELKLTVSDLTDPAFAMPMVDDFNYVGSTEHY